MLAKKILVWSAAFTLITSNFVFTNTDPKSKEETAYKKTSKKRAGFIPREQTAYETLMKKRGFTIKKSPKTSKTDLYTKTSERIFSEEIVPYLKTYDYNSQKNPDGIFDTNNKVFWETDWNDDSKKHRRIAIRANKFITGLIKKIVKHKNNRRYLNYLKSDDFKYQTWSTDLLEKIDNLVTFYNLRLNKYKEITNTRDEIKRLQTYMTNLRAELITISNRYFKYTPIERIKLTEAEQNV